MSRDWTVFRSLSLLLMRAVERIGTLLIVSNVLVDQSGMQRVNCKVCILIDPMFVHSQNKGIERNIHTETRQSMIVFDSTPL